MEKNPKVFIIILNYNGADCLPRTVGGVFSLKYPNFEIILVDNNSTDGSFEMIKEKFPKMIFIKNSCNLGFSAGNNVGIKYALERGADYVLLLNYDTQIKPDILNVLIEKMEKDQKIGLASPLILKGNSKKIWFSGGKISWLEMKTKHLQKELASDFFDSDFITGCALLISKKVFRQIGLLDETYFLYWEDVDFSQKAKGAGFKLLVSPNCQIYHFEKSENEKTQKIYWLVLSGLIFFQKNTPFFLRPYIFFYFLLRKFKNKKDLRLNPNLISLSVSKAYQDFSYAKEKNIHHNS